MTSPATGTEAWRDLRGDGLRRRLRGASAAVLGLGRSGQSAARLLLRLGAQVFLSESEPASRARVSLPADLRSCAGEFGGHSPQLLRRDIVIVSPGVPWDLPLLAEARRRRVPVWGELELGWRLARSSRTAAVTGTNGKTTTTALLGDMCARAGRKTFVGGNIGRPLCGAADARFDALVLEVSSYQLESAHLFRPDAAAILNVTPDHLLRHKTMAAYAGVKARIYRSQRRGDVCLFNADDAWCRKLARGCRSRALWFSLAPRPGAGVFYRPEKRLITAGFGRGGRRYRFPAPARLIGLHNVENACAAVGAALALGVAPGPIRESLLRFPGVEHRLEKVRVVRGVAYVNDSKSTNVDSTLKALQAFNAPLWLILGGEDKGAPYAPLRPLIERRVKGILLIGEAAGKIRSELGGACELVPARTLARAVRTAAERAEPGDTVLLSPACASFDQFENFEDRGRRYKGLVRGL